MSVSAKINIKTKTFKTLNVLGFSPIDYLTVVVILASLDQANCLAMMEKEIADFLAISPRTVIRTMAKLKTFGVFKNGNRYDFSAFLKTLEDLESPIDNKQQEC
jgi:hypothetical protein